MAFISKSVAAALATLIGLAVAPALAAPNAYCTKDADAYAKKSSNSMVLYSFDAGDQATVVNCDGTYCLVQLPGPDGYVKQNRLGMLQGGKPNSKIPFSFGLSVGGDGKPSISIGIGEGGQPPIVTPSEPDEVCFYTGSNYKGSSFCVEPGDSDDSLSGKWDDEISSIEVSGNAEVTVCRDEDLDGVCADLDHSVSSLPAKLNNNISSYEVN